MPRSECLRGCRNERWSWRTLEMLLIDELTGVLTISISRNNTISNHNDIYWLQLSDSHLAQEPVPRLNLQMDGPARHPVFLLAQVRRINGAEISQSRNKYETNRYLRVITDDATPLLFLFAMKLTSPSFTGELLADEFPVHSCIALSWIISVLGSRVTSFGGFWYGRRFLNSFSLTR